MWNKNCNWSTAAGGEEEDDDDDDDNTKPRTSRKSMLTRGFFYSINTALLYNSYITRHFRSK